MRVTLVCMASTLTIRLSPEDRAALEEVAREHGMGVSAFVRQLTEAEIRRARREAIRAEGDRVVAYLAENPSAREEMEDLGTPQSDVW